MANKVTMEFVPVPAAIPYAVAVELAKLNDLVSPLDEITKIGTSTIEHLRTGQGSNHRLVAYIIVCKAFKTFQAAQLLCRTGYGSDALSLCASLFENVIDLLYMGKTPVLRPLRYLQFEQVEKLWRAMKVLRKKRLPHGCRKKYRQYKETLDSQTAKLLKYFPDENKGWSQRSLFQRVKALGLLAELDYNEKYWIYCGHKHTLPMAVSGWTIDLPRGHVDIATGPDVKEVLHGVNESAGRFLQLCLAADDAFRLLLGPQIKSASNNFSSVVESIARKYPELQR